MCEPSKLSLRALPTSIFVRRGGSRTFGSNPSRSCVQMTSGARNAGASCCYCRAVGRRSVESDRVQPSPGDVFRCFRCPPCFGSRESTRLGRGSGITLERVGCNTFRSSASLVPHHRGIDSVGAHRPKGQAHTGLSLSFSPATVLSFRARAIPIHHHS